MFMQGLVLMVVGASAVFLLLGLLVFILSFSEKVIGRFNHLLPDEAPRARGKRKPTGAAPRGAGAKGAADDDAAVAVAIAAAVARMRNG